MTIVLAPEIGTEAVDATDLDHEAEASEGCVIRDTVAYKGLTPGRTYTLTGTLMDKETGEPVVSGGEPVTAETTFLAEAADGSADVRFAFDAGALSGHDVVAFEELSRDGREIAVHADIEDENQTVRLTEPEEPEEPEQPGEPEEPEQPGETEEPTEPGKPAEPSIGTLATDAADGDHEIAPVKDAKVVDEVAYEGLVPGAGYTLTGTLMDKETGKPVKSGGKDVTATVAFAPEKAEGSVKVEFELDATELAGRSLVAFEYLRKDGEDVAAHADITDAGQTVAMAKPAAPVKAAMPTTGDVLPMVPVAAAALGSGLLAAVALLIRRRDPGKRAAHAARPEDDGDGFGWEDLDGNSAA